MQDNNFEWFDDDYDIDMLDQVEIRTNIDESDLKYLNARKRLENHLEHKRLQDNLYDVFEDSGFPNDKALRLANVERKSLNTHINH